jgi:hypothetical protein
MRYTGTTLIVSLRFRYLILLLVLALPLSGMVLGCRITSLAAHPRGAAAALSPTRTPQPTFTSTPTFTPQPTATQTPTVTPTPLPTNTPLPTATPVPTDTPKPTPKPTPRPPTDTPVPATEEPAAPQPPPSCAYQWCPGSWYVGARNEGLTRFYGHLTDTSGTRINGFFVRVQCGGWTALSFPSGPSSVAPHWEPGFYDIAVQNAPLTLDCTLQVVMYKCGTWFDATCSSFDPLSEAVAVHTDAGAGETIIIADWVCHHDCTAPKRW